MGPVVHTEKFIIRTYYFNIQDEEYISLGPPRGS